MYHKEAISSSPLPAYASALLFSPTGSLIRQLFKHESEEVGIKIKPAMSESWSACLQTLEGHTDRVTCVAFSNNSIQIASASRDKTIKIWDLSSGACLQTLEGHTDGATCVAFSQDSTQLASASFSSTVKIWDTNSGACLWTLEGHSSAVMSVSFLHHPIQLASGSRDSTIKI
jgi:WD40 repeat protein